MNDDESDDMILGIPYGSDVNGACMLPNFDKVQEVSIQLIMTLLQIYIREFMRME